MAIISAHIAPSKALVFSWWSVGDKLHWFQRDGDGPQQWGVYTSRLEVDSWKLIEVYEIVVIQQVQQRLNGQFPPSNDYYRFTRWKSTRLDDFKEQTKYRSAVVSWIDVEFGLV